MEETLHGYGKMVVTLINYLGLLENLTTGKEWMKIVPELYHNII
jgi:hypothetical protein